jgi:hypothetical protein
MILVGKFHFYNIISAVDVATLGFSTCLLLQVQITHRIAWRRDSPIGRRCTQTAIDAQSLQSDEGHLACQSGCSGTIGDFSYYCTDFSVADNWSAGERTYMYSNFTGPFFEAA